MPYQSICNQSCLKSGVSPSRTFMQTHTQASMYDTLYCIYLLINKERGYSKRYLSLDVVMVAAYYCDIR